MRPVIPTAPASTTATPADLRTTIRASPPVPPAMIRSNWRRAILSGWIRTPSNRPPIRRCRTFWPTIRIPTAAVRYQAATEVHATGAIRIPSAGGTLVVPGRGLGRGRRLFTGGVAGCVRLPRKCIFHTLSSGRPKAHPVMPLLVCRGDTPTLISTPPSSLKRPLPVGVSSASCSRSQPG